MTNFTILAARESGLSNCGTQNAASFNELSIRIGDTYFIIPTNELPSDFDTETYTIVGGELVRASAEQIAEREATAAAAYNERQRLARQAEYRAITDPQVIELIADATPEIAALKAQIRKQYPYK